MQGRLTPLDIECCYILMNREIKVIMIILVGSLFGSLYIQIHIVVQSSSCVAILENAGALDAAFTNLGYWLLDVHYMIKSYHLIINHQSALLFSLPLLTYFSSIS